MMVNISLPVLPILDEKEQRALDQIKIACMDNLQEIHEAWVDAGGKVILGDGSGSVYDVVGPDKKLVKRVR